MAKNLVTARPSLSTALSLARIGVGFIWWTTILALVVAAALAAVGPFVFDRGASFTVESRVRVTSLVPDLDGRVGGVEVRPSANPALDEFSATLDWKPETAVSLFLTVVPFTLLGLLWLFGVHQMRALLSDVSSDIVFTDRNARRIRRVGWILVATALAYRPLEWLSTRAVLASFDLEDQGLRPALNTDGWLLAIITGLLVLGLGEVWRHGVEIEQENRLTV